MEKEKGAGLRRIHFLNKKKHKFAKAYGPTRDRKKRPDTILGAGQGRSRVIGGGVDMKLRAHELWGRNETSAQARTGRKALDRTKEKPDFKLTSQM